MDEFLHPRIFFKDLDRIFLSADKCRPQTHIAGEEQDRRPRKGKVGPSRVREGGQSISCPLRPRATIVAADHSRNISYKTLKNLDQQKCSVLRLS